MTEEEGVGMTEEEGVGMTEEEGVGMTEAERKVDLYIILDRCG